MRRRSNGAKRNASGPWTAHLLWRISGRQHRLQKSLPDGLDLLVICVEVGLGLDQAILRVADELQIVEVAKMADAKHAILQDAQAVAQTHVVLFQDGGAQGIGAVTLGQTHRGQR